MWDSVERRPYLAVALICLALFLPGLFRVPPVDRDEARFAQASKQMLETGDFVSIRFQDTARNKKPVGIYWLQAGAVALFETPPYDAIWAYRLPSLAGALLAALLTLWAGTPLFGRRAALFGALILASSVMLCTEARLAKTDAALLAAIVASQGVLARAYLAREGEAVSRPLALLFWIAQGAGILLKGPIAPFLSALTALTLGLADRNWAWLRQLRPVTGLLALFLVVAPWAIAIGLATHGQFFAEAVRGDMAAKLAAGQESHGAPPGTHLVLAILTFWPGTLFLLPAFLHGFGRRAEPAFRFLLAWAVPAWLVFEAVPTKLPHYVLPVFPALALLCGAAIEAARAGEGVPFKGWPAGLAAFGFAAVALALALAQVIAPPLAGGTQLLAFCIAILAAAGIAAGFMQRRAPQAALGAAVIASFLACGATFGLLAPGLEKLWIAPRLLALLPRSDDGALPPLLVSGFSEPSLVFLAGTRTRFLPPKSAADAMTAETVAAIWEPGLSAFRAQAASRGLKLREIGRVSGLNYSVGKPITLTLFRTSP